MSLLFPQQRSPLINHIPPNNGNMGLPLVALLSPFLRAKRRLVPQWTIIPRAARHCVPQNNTLERWRCSQGQRSDKKKKKHFPADPLAVHAPEDECCCRSRAGMQLKTHRRRAATGRKGRPAARAGSQAASRAASQAAWRGRSPLRTENKH